MTNHLQREFRFLFKSAEEASRIGESTWDFEDDFLRVLQYLKLNSHNKDELSRALIELMREVDFDARELVGFCMHELQWEEVKCEAQRLIELNDDWRAKKGFIDIVAAFDKNWEDRNLYRYYEDRKGR